MDESACILANASILEAYISSTFVITKEEARDWAIGLAQFVHGHSDPAVSTPFNLSDWYTLIHKRVGERFDWRDPQKKEAWLREQSKGVEGYREYLDSHRPSPFKKW